MSKSRTITKLTPVHPGEILKDELDAAGISLNALSRALHVPMNRISHIVNGKRGITADAALRLGRLFGTSAELWMNLQKNYELRVARDAVEKQIEREVTAFAEMTHP